RRPRLGVAALNPHASDGGLFGDEEERLIRPAVEAARAEGIDASGPWPSDTLFGRARPGGVGGVVAVDHEQGANAREAVGGPRADGGGGRGGGKRERGAAGGGEGRAPGPGVRHRGPGRGGRHQLAGGGGGGGPPVREVMKAACGSSGSRSGDPRRD